MLLSLATLSGFLCVLLRFVEFCFVINHAARVDFTEGWIFQTCSSVTRCTFVRRRFMRSVECK